MSRATMPGRSRLRLWRNMVIAWLTFCLSSLHILELRAQGAATDTVKVQPTQGNAAGKLHGPFNYQSQIFPGTVRDYWVYVPRQYKSEKPACTLIIQDGLNRAKEWRIPELLDQLIDSGELPVMIGIFVNPGIVPATAQSAQPRFNRSFEYDSLGDNYARFLIEEMLPEVRKTYAISTNPNDIALAGASSGGICAFNAAWERPDAFRRVLCTIGTFVGLRGGNQLPMLVRKTEPKPLRVFLEDGNHDLNIYGGDWWIANQDMLSALKYSGYDVQHAWGDGGHDGQHAAEIMPDALRWLWRNYPEPITARAPTTDPRRMDIITPHGEWELVSSGHELVEAPAFNSSGEIFFCDSRAGRIYRIGSDGKTRVFAEQTGRVTGMSFGPDGKLYACQSSQRRIVRYDDFGKNEVLLNETACHDLVTLPKGFYYTDPVTPAVWWSDYSGSRRKVDELTTSPSGLTASADQAFLHVASGRSSATVHFRIAVGGNLEHRQLFGYLQIPDRETAGGAGGMTVDTEGRIYVATRLGVQVLDQLGRCHWILSKPSNSMITGVTFGGIDMGTLYVTCGEKVFSRKLKSRGVPSFGTAVAQPKPQL